MFLLHLFSGPILFPDVVFCDENLILTFDAWLDHLFVTERVDGLMDTIESDVSLVADVVVIVNPSLDALQHLRLVNSELHVLSPLS